MEKKRYGIFGRAEMGYAVIDVIPLPATDRTVEILDVITKAKMQVWERRNALIELVEWYREKYHKPADGHRELIEKIKECTTFDELEQYEQVVDGWLDY